MQQVRGRTQINERVSQSHLTDLVTSNADHRQLRRLPT